MQLNSKEIMSTQMDRVKEEENGSSCSSSDFSEANIEVNEEK